MDIYSKKPMAAIAICMLLLIIWAVWLFQKVTETPRTEPLLPVTESLPEDLTFATNVKAEGDIDVLLEEANSQVLVEEAEEISEELISEPTPDEKLSAALANLQERIAQDGGVLLHPLEEANSEYRDLRGEMARALSDDPSLLEGLIDAFVQDPYSLLGREIGAVLSENGAPEFQAAALDIGLDPYHHSHDERAAALLAISNMDTVTGDTRDQLLSSLATEQDSEMLQYSLLAMRPAPSNEEDYARVNETLSMTIQNDDQDVRRLAAYQMSEWATSNDDLAPLRAMALEEQDINARARAIMSIGESPIKSDDNKAVLLAAVNNETEFAPVRQAAWKSLQSYPLTDSELADYQNVGEKIKQAVAAESYH